MAEVALLACERERELFAQLTYPRFVRCLTEPGWPIVAVGAVAGGRPIGLALVLVAGVTGRLLSLNVEPIWRQRGLGTALLAACESALALRGAIEIVATHSSRTVARAAFERTLAAARWEPTELTGLRVSARCGPLLEAVGGWLRCTGCSPNVSIGTVHGPILTKTIARQSSSFADSSHAGIAPL
jgi:GNAT superfamily N-acetyltransferase